MQFEKKDLGTASKFELTPEDRSLYLENRFLKPF